MAYFNHAFKKAFLAQKVAQDGLLSADVPAGHVGFATQQATGLVTSGVTNKMMTLVQGSFAPSDKIGNNPGHGGYQESVKSKGINPKYISRLWKTECCDAAPSTVVIEACDACFKCDETYFGRMDVKGSPALRFLNHNAYGDTDSGGICCDSTNSVTINDVDYVEPSLVLARLALGLIENPVLAPFISVVVEYSIDGGTTYVAIPNDDLATYAGQAWSGTTSNNCGRITITGAYVDTKFGNCSFDTRDHYNVEPVQLYFDLKDESGNPCDVKCASITRTAGTTQQTHGDTVLRDILMTESYRQSPYNQGNKDSARIREIEGSSAIVDAVPRFDANGDPILYTSYNILHSIPRLNNPTGVFDNDQYHLVIYVACTDTTQIDKLDDMFDELSSVIGLGEFPVPFESTIDACATSFTNP
tara:strand:+ start:24668 stop:25915 length:1248 start_codon:yes stop_codon:yes gene_type:complete